ncbi:MAG: isopentenyl-diphosphate Delta-isomerase [Cyclobacteriaceae bacterium]
MEHVILVDKYDNEVGTMEKLEAHRKGVLHRAFSVLVFNSKGEMLIQRRAGCKYHSAGLWTNACCSHPRAGEQIEKAAQRRLKEEIGLNLQPEKAYSFIYKTELDNGLIENELDHVLVATSDGEPVLNPLEAQDWKYISMPELRSRMESHPAEFTHWFKLIVNHSELNALVTALPV